MAASFQRKPPLVLSHAQARHRAAQGAGRTVSLDLAVRRDRSQARRTQVGSSCFSTARPRCAICSTRPKRRYTRNCISPSRRPFSSMSTRARSFTFAPRSASAAVFRRLSRSGLADPRLRAMMSMRADFLGELQKDEPLYAVHRQINVPPLREAELREVVSRPAELLSARFETDGLADIITRRTAEDSVKDVGALPLLSYTLDDMWTQMVKRGDGVLRLPAQSFELGGVLVDRADAFLAAHPKSEDELRRIFTLKLATVREGEEPTRRRACALRVHGRGMAAGQRACRSSQPPARHGNTRGRRDLRRGGARGDLPAMGQAARLDCCGARVSRLENGARSGSPRLARRPPTVRKTTRC